MAIAERALTAAALVRRSSQPASRGGSDPLRPIRYALTSAASRWTEKLDKSGAIRSKAWQDRVWAYYDALGEIHYAADFFGSNLGRIRLIVQERTAEGEWEEVTAGEPFAALEALRGPRGDRSDLQKAYGEIHFLVGEGYLFGAREVEGQGETTAVVWEFLSAAEIEVSKTEIKRKARQDAKAGEKATYQRSATMTPGPGEAVALRLWTPHPRFSGDAEAPMQAVLDLCEELALLGRAVRSRARSRLASAGLLVVPTELTDDSPTETPGQDENPDEDPLLTELIDTASTALQDEESAAASVPIVMRADGAHIKNIQHIKFVDPAQAYPETEREVHVIARIAQGLKLPPEVLQGMADANHWSAWQISEAMWEQHLEPVAIQLVGDLTSAYLAPILNDTEGKYRVWYDDAGLVTKPDRTGDAQEAHDRLIISDEALREVMGFDENDEPDEDELRRRIGVKLNDVGVALGGDPTSGGSSGTSGDGDGEPSAGPSNTDKGPPSGEAAAHRGAALVALARCREAAGARVLTRLQREANAPDLSQVPRHLICAHLGEDAVKALGLTPRTLIAGGCAPLRAAGFPIDLAARVQSHAALTLFDPEPPPVGLASDA